MCIRVCTGTLFNHTKGNCIIYSNTELEYAKLNQSQNDKLHIFSLTCRNHTQHSSGDQSPRRVERRGYQDDG